MFEPGQLVECIDGSFPKGSFDIFNALPKKGWRYTVRDLVPGIDNGGGATCAVYLEGIEEEFAESEGEEWKG